MRANSFLILISFLFSTSILAEGEKIKTTQSGRGSASTQVQAPKAASATGSQDSSQQNKPEYKKATKEKADTPKVSF